MQRLTEPDDGELRRAVDAERGDPAEPRQRGGVHDVTLVLLEQERQEGVHAVHHPVEVHPEHPIPELERRADDAAAPHPGVVAHHVHRAEGLERPVANPVDVGRHRHVGVDPDDAGTPGFEVGHGDRERRLLHVGQHEAHPGGGEPLGEGTADTAGAPGDDRHPVPELAHPRLPARGVAAVVSLPQSGRPRLILTVRDVCSRSVTGLSSCGHDQRRRGGARDN